MSQFWGSNNSHQGTKRLHYIYKWTSTCSLLTFWQRDYGAVKRQDDLELWRKAREKSARLILCFEAPPRPCSTSASGQAGGTTRGKLLSARRYRCQPDKGVPSLAVMVTLSQQRSYCNIPAIWHSSFSIPLQTMSLPHNEFQIFLFVCFLQYLWYPWLQQKEQGKKKPNAKTLLLDLFLFMPHV